MSRSPAIRLAIRRAMPAAALAMTALAAVATAGCRGGAGDTAAAPAPARLDTIARRYVVLGLQLGHHDANYVDAYYGPDSLRAAADRDTLSLAAIATAADSLVRLLGDGVPAYADSIVRLRHAYLRGQLGAMAARARMVGGTRLPFDSAALALFDARPPHHDDAHFDSLLGRLDAPARRGTPTTGTRAAITA